MVAGQSTSDAPTVLFDLAGPANNKPGYYDWDKNNFAPRLAVAWTPQADCGFCGKLTGNGKMVVRGGYSIVYDRIGTALATNFDKAGAFGLSTDALEPVRRTQRGRPDIRFAGLDVIPPTLPDAPPGGFPQTPPSYTGIITEALDGNIVTPYSHSFNIIVGRELGHGYSIEAAYVGRRGRNLLVRRDVAMPANLVDPKSGVDYFTAAKQLINRLEVASRQHGRSLGLQRHRADSVLGEPVPGCRAGRADGDAADGGGVQRRTLPTTSRRSTTPTRAAIRRAAPSARLRSSRRNTTRSACRARSADRRTTRCSSRCASASATATSSTSTTPSATPRITRRCSKATRRSQQFGNGGYTGFLINSWEPDKSYGNADFDVRHLLNVNWIAELPFGQGHHFGSDLRGVARRDHRRMVDGGRLPLDAAASRSPSSTAGSAGRRTGTCRATRNWSTPGVLPAIGHDEGRDRRLSEPVQRSAGGPRRLPARVSRRSRPAQRAARRRLLLDRLEPEQDVVDAVGEHQRLRFRWDTFNLTNTPKFDVQFLDVYPDRANTFGRYFNTIATCDGGAGRCMQFALQVRILEREESGRANGFSFWNNTLLRPRRTEIYPDPQ